MHILAPKNILNKLTSSESIAYWEGLISTIKKLHKRPGQWSVDLRKEYGLVFLMSGLRTNACCSIISTSSSITLTFHGSTFFGAITMLIADYLVQLSKAPSGGQCALYSRYLQRFIYDQHQWWLLILVLARHVEQLCSTASIPKALLFCQEQNPDDIFGLLCWGHASPLLFASISRGFCSISILPSPLMSLS